MNSVMALNEARPSAVDNAALKLRSIWRPETAIVLLAVGLQFVYFTGVISSDDVNYLNLAWHAKMGLSIPPELHYFLGRFIHWKLLELVITVVPMSWWTLAVIPMGATLATMFVIRAFARDYLDPGVIPWALLVFALIPLVVINASVGVPDPLAMALGWTGIYLAAGALLRADTRWAAARCWGAGVLIMLGYDAKESVAALVPAALLFVLLFRRRYRWAWKRAGWLALGAALWTSCEWTLMWWWTGDPLFHNHKVIEAHRMAGPFVELVPAALLHYWADYLRWLLDMHGDFAPLGPILLAGVFYALLRPHDGTRLLLCAVLPMLAYLSAGSSELTLYAPLAHQPRYLLPALPGLALLAGVMLRQMGRAGTWPRRTLVAVAIPLAAWSMITPNRLAGKWYNAATFAGCYQLFAEHLPAERPGQRLCAAQLTYNRVAIFQQWLGSPPVELIKAAPGTAQQWVEQYPGALVVTTHFDRRGALQAKHAAYSLNGPGYNGLREFELVARCAPAGDRLSALKARLLGRPIPANPHGVAELWRVPTAKEYLSKYSAQGNALSSLCHSDSR